MSVGSSIQLLLLMSTDIKNSNEAHERHDSTGVTVANATWKVKVRDSKARDEKIEGGSESLIRSAKQR